MSRNIREDNKFVSKVEEVYSYLYNEYDVLSFRDNIVADKLLSTGISRDQFDDARIILNKMLDDKQSVLDKMHSMIGDDVYEECHELYILSNKYLDEHNIYLSVKDAIDKL